MWWSDNPQGFPRYRVSYVKETGDVYAVNHSTGLVEVLGTVEPDPVPDSNFTSPWERPLEVLLADEWTDWCGKPGGLQWFRDKLAAHKPRDLALTLASDDSALD